MAKKDYYFSEDSRSLGRNLGFNTWMKTVNGVEFSYKIAHDEILPLWNDAILVASGEESDMDVQDVLRTKLK